MEPFGFMWGTNDPGVIDAAIRRLYLHPNNRFSHRHTTIAAADGVICGFMIAYTYTILNKLLWPTAWQLLRVLGFWRFFKAIVLNVDLLLGKEASKGEFHTYLGGVPKRFRRLGVGTMFVFEAERIAQELKCIGVSCTADSKQKTIDAGLALGYHITNSFKLRNGDTYHRILKVF